MLERNCRLICIAIVFEQHYPNSHQISWDSSFSSSADDIQQIETPAEPSLAGDPLAPSQDGPGATLSPLPDQARRSLPSITFQQSPDSRPVTGGESAQRAGVTQCPIQRAPRAHGVRPRSRDPSRQRSEKKLGTELSLLTKFTIT